MDPVDREEDLPPRDEVELVGSAFQAVADAFIVYDLTGKPLVWNGAYNRMVNCSDEEIRARMAWDFHPPEDVEFVAGTFLEVIESGEPSYIEAGVKTRTGRVIPCGLTGSALKNGHGETIALCGVGRDLTQQKRAEAIYGMVLRSTLEGFCVLDLDGTMLEVNDAYCEMLGYSREEILGIDIADVEVNESPSEVKEHVQRILATGHDRFETRHRRKDGGIMDVEVSVSFKDVDHGRFYSFTRDITQRKRIEAELREHRDNLQGLVRERTRELEELNAQLVHEITERGLAEKELRRVNQELEEYAQTVSHEIRTPLSGIFLALEYLERLAGTMSPGGLDQEMAGIVQSAKSAVSTTEGQVDRLLKLARAGQVPEEVGPVDISSVVQGVLCDLQEEAVRANATFDVRGDLGSIRADTLHVQQVFSNLIANAIRHNSGGDPEIRVSRLDGPGHRFMVRDSGIGLPEELTGNLSDPVTLGKRVKAGLGLAIVGKIVRVYNGSLKAYNDGGACFEFVLYDYQR
ncbi:MAG: PAS domain S-box protein [Actinobacteria bacterium]|nr:PAS domain S-box protein [Actinomycetota bacterium]MBU1942598.1 PAS domain S-box protein [Actinomycetota bacterium]MBU2688726.1 PAS domain S-box protein [Actinomycetota bacterium]